MNIGYSGMSEHDKKLREVFLKSKKKYVVIDGTAYFRDGSTAWPGNYRQFSQLGTWRGWPMGWRNMGFGDLYISREGHSIYRTVLFKAAIICQEIKFPNKLFRFARS